MRLSLRVQQTALFVLVILAAVLLLSVWVYGDVRNGIADEARAERARDASAVAAVLGGYFPLTATSTVELHERVGQLSRTLDSDVRVFDVAGRPVDVRATLRLSPALLDEARRLGGRDGGFSAVDVGAGGAAVAAMPVRERPGGPAGVVVVANDLSSQRATLDRLRGQLALASLFATLLAGVLGLLFSEIITRNTKRLIAAADAIADGDFTRRMPRNALPDEIRTLVESFNRMAEQLGDAFDTLKGQEAAQRQFVANASHELRTPIAALKGAIEILEGGAKEKPAARDEFLATMRVEVDRLQRLVDNLFTLAQVDAGRLRLRLRPEPLDEIVRVVAGSMGPLANDAGVAIQTELPPEGIAAVCDRDQVTQVLVGFTDNAIKHTPAGGVVTLRAEPVGDAVLVCVSDTGSGVPADVLPHVFDRFYTQRKAAEGKRRGSGLGLAIAREIVEAHGSHIEVTSTPGEGATFCFTLKR